MVIRGLFDLGSAKALWANKKHQDSGTSSLLAGLAGTIAMVDTQQPTKYPGPTGGRKITKISCGSCVAIPGSA